MPPNGIIRGRRQSAAGVIRGQGRSLYSAKPFGLPDAPPPRSATRARHRCHPASLDFGASRSPPWRGGRGEPARAWHCTASGLGRGSSPTPHHHGPQRALATVATQRPSISARAVRHRGGVDVGSPQGLGTAQQAASAADASPTPHHGPQRALAIGALAVATQRPLDFGVSRSPPWRGGRGEPARAWHCTASGLGRECLPDAPPPRYATRARHRCPGRCHPASLDFSAGRSRTVAGWTWGARKGLALHSKRPWPRMPPRRPTTTVSNARSPPLPPSVPRFQREPLAHRGGVDVGSPQGLGTAQRAASAAEASPTPHHRGGPQRALAIGGLAVATQRPSISARAVRHRGGADVGSPQGLGTAQQAALAADASPTPHHHGGPQRALAIGGLAVATQRPSISARAVRHRGGADVGSPQGLGTAQQAALAADASPTPHHGPQCALAIGALAVATQRPSISARAVRAPWRGGRGEPARAWHCTTSGLGRGCLPDAPPPRSATRARHRCPGRCQTASLDFGPSRSPPWRGGRGEPARAWHCTASGLGRGCLPDAPPPRSATRARHRCSSRCHAASLDFGASRSPPWRGGRGEPARAWHCTASGLGRGGRRRGCRAGARPVLVRSASNASSAGAHPQCPVRASPRRRDPRLRVIRHHKHHRHGIMALRVHHRHRVRALGRAGRYRRGKRRRQTARYGGARARAPSRQPACPSRP